MRQNEVSQADNAIRGPRGDSEAEGVTNIIETHSEEVITVSPGINDYVSPTELSKEGRLIGTTSQEHASPLLDEPKDPAQSLSILFTPEFKSKGPIDTLNRGNILRLLNSIPRLEKLS